MKSISWRGDRRVGDSLPDTLDMRLDNGLAAIDDQYLPSHVR